jgi:hypothetical protein
MSAIITCYRIFSKEGNMATLGIVMQKSGTYIGIGVAHMFSSTSSLIGEPIFVKGTVHEDDGTEKDAYYPIGEVVNEARESDSVVFQLNTSFVENRILPDPFCRQPIVLQRVVK